jgi:acetyl-CoA synthetase
LVAHPDVAEAAVVGCPHDVKGQGIYAYVICNQSAAQSKPEDVVQQLKQQVRTVIGAIAVPDRIQIVPGLPKTRSGKIMRRILRKIAEGNYTQLGDITTLADPAVVEQIVQGHRSGG